MTPVEGLTSLSKVYNRTMFLCSCLTGSSPCQSGIFLTLNAKRTQGFFKGLKLTAEGLVKSKTP
jgi:hypothetical protein